MFWGVFPNDIVDNISIIVGETFSKCIIILCATSDWFWQSQLVFVMKFKTIIILMIDLQRRTPEISSPMYSLIIKAKSHDY